MGDSRRFDLFADLSLCSIPLQVHIADVAGGKGGLQAALYLRGFTDVTSWDIRKKYAKDRRGYRFGRFNWRTSEKYDAVLAMHPDDATDHVILYAATHHIPALVCPCCTRPSAVQYEGNTDYPSWVEHLMWLAWEHGASIRKTFLPMGGASSVLMINL